MSDTLAVTEIEPEVRRRYSRLAAPFSGLFVSLGTSAVGLGIVAANVGRLRWAHLSRQQSGEGIAFFQVGIGLIGGGLLATGGAIALVVISRRVHPGVHRLARAAAGIVMMLLAIAALIALWVQSHGARCIGSCG